jgi:hypothetical protein
MGFLSSLFSGASKAMSYAPKVFGAFQKGARNFGKLESGARKFGSTINKISGNKIGESEFGKKVYSAYDKVAGLGNDIAKEAPEIEKSFNTMGLKTKTM